MEINKKKKYSAAISIVSNIFLTLLKIIAGIVSGSLSIISEAIHSLSDLLASVLTFFSVMKSSKPADDDHPFGHGKYEDMSGLIEGILIIFASIFIIYEAVKKIVLSSHFQFENNCGIVVMGIAVIVNYFVSELLLKVAKESNSISLYADGKHLRADIYSSVGVLVGLILIKITGYAILDSIIAILVALIIYKTGHSITKKAFMDLLDHSLPEEDIKKIENIIHNFSCDTRLKENGIKARRTGPSIDIDIILQFREDTTICKCHKICDDIEKQIQASFLNASISIHTEPVCYKKDCTLDCKKAVSKL